MILLTVIETKGLNSEEDLTDLLKKVRGAIAVELNKGYGKRIMDNKEIFLLITRYP